jgi:hypothetical protein
MTPAEATALLQSIDVLKSVVMALVDERLGEPATPEVEVAPVVIAPAAASPAARQRKGGRPRKHFAHRPATAAERVAFSRQSVAKPVAKPVSKHVAKPPCDSLSSFLSSEQKIEIDDDARARAIDENLRVVQFPEAETGDLAIQLAREVKQIVVGAGKLYPDTWNDTLAVAEADEVLKHAVSKGLNPKRAFGTAVDAARLATARATSRIKVFGFFVAPNIIPAAHAKALDAAKRVQAAAAQAMAAQVEMFGAVQGTNPDRGGKNVQTAQGGTAGWQARRDAGHAALAKLRASVEDFDRAAGGSAGG